MDIQQFLNHYGYDSTTNFQLIRWSRELGFKIKYVMRNELENLKEFKSYARSKQPIYIICNYQTSEEKGSHHVALFKDEEKAYYFDSYGIQPFTEAIDFLEDGISSKFKIQPNGSKICGQLSIYVLYKLFQGKDFYKTVLDLNEYFNS